MQQGRFARLTGPNQQVPRYSIEGQPPGLPEMGCLLDGLDGVLELVLKLPCPCLFPLRHGLGCSRLLASQEALLPIAWEQAAQCHNSADDRDDGGQEQDYGQKAPEPG